MKYKTLVFVVIGLIALVFAATPTSSDAAAPVIDPCLAEPTP
jgi:hypothetical protein